MPMENKESEDNLQEDKLKEQLAALKSGEQQLNEQKAMQYFLGLKRQYQDQRTQGDWENKWQQATAAVYGTDDLRVVYEGRAKIKSPIMKWKVRGIKARINRILFNVEPIARFEDAKINGPREKFVDLWNKFIFTYQLKKIKFKQAFKLNQMVKCVLGTNVAKITQEYKESTVQYFDDMKENKEPVKDNTYYRPLIITEFYSDVSKPDINESAACIHSTVIPMQELISLEKKTVDVEYALFDKATGQQVGNEIVKEGQGLYHNLHLLTTSDGNITIEQEEYMQRTGLSKKAQSDMTKMLKDSEKTGYIAVDECYGKYWHEGEWVECMLTIAQGRVVIRGPEPTPFKHKSYVRPFIVGVYEPIQGCLYGDSNVVAGHNLLMELNASRAQVTDAKTRAISPMWYMDINKDVVWDRVWRPNGLIKGNGQKGIELILNPYLGNIAMEDANIIQRDIDQLWNLSPIQEGTTDSRFIPSTASQTTQVISQNDMPLNDIIDDTIENEIKPFLEMLYERNMTFKAVSDLLTVWTKDDLAKAGVEIGQDGVALWLNEETGQPEPITMETMMMANMETTVLGSLELSNEVARQNGILNFVKVAETNPVLARRTNWDNIADILLESFGIKDLKKSVWLDEQVVQQAQQQQAQVDQQAQQQQQQATLNQEQMAMQHEANLKKMDLEAHQIKAQVDVQANDAKVNKQTEAELVKMQAQATIENTTRARI